MSDMFRTEIEHQFPHGTSMWDVIARVVDYLSDLLSSRTGTLNRSEFRGSDPQASTVTRGSIAELQSALRSHHIAVETVHVSLGLADDPERPWSESTKVELRVWFTGRSIESRVDLKIASTDKVVLVGLKTQIESELELISTEMSAQNPPAVTAGRGSFPVIGGLPADRVREPSRSRENMRDWVVRTWRDHTATFVTTTVGGLLVIVIGVWFGLAR